MIPQPDKAALVSVTKDSYGEIVSAPETEFACLIDRKDQMVYYNGNLMDLGKGRIFITSTSLTFVVGQGIKVDGVFYVVKSVEPLYVLGQFHHWEVVYG